MKIPITKYGTPQVVIFPVITIGLMLILSLINLPYSIMLVGEILLAIVLIWILAFFRDPPRQIPQDDSLLLSPADGKITDIETVENGLIEGKSLRIGIFLSIFNVHINRSPCDATVADISYKKGLYKNAMNPVSSKVNESNTVVLSRSTAAADKIIVRQISGAIARRIVCKAKAGQNLQKGEKFGMIKFGSRTELYVPVSENLSCLVKIGDKVKAGLTPLAKYGK